MAWALLITSGVQAATSRTSYVVGEISSANAALSESSRSEKYAQMKESPFAFFRGSNPLYWKDLGRSSQLGTFGGVAATRTWLNGDMHADNTGAFDDDQGAIVFALNDFDEALVGDYQLDVWRLATSLVLIARQNGVFSAPEQDAIVDAFSEAYLDTMDSYVGNDGELTRKFLASNTYGLLDEFLADAAASNSRVEMLDTWTVKVGGIRAFNTASNPDLAPVTASVESDLRGRMASYRSTLSGGATFSSSYFTVKSVAARLHAGLGSLGVPRYYVLIEGASSAQDDDRILDVKAQGTPSAWAYVDAASVSQTQGSCGGNMALRTVVASKALGYRVDDHLGWMTLADGRTYSVRERSPFKETFPTADLNTLTRMTNLAEQWGEVLATHHARADKDWDGTQNPYSVDKEIQARTNGNHSGFRTRVRAIATDYANQVQYDFASFSANF